MTAELTAVGVTCGIGSLLVGARQAGFRVVGNVEWRKYYHARDQHGRNTFEANFPGVPFPGKLDDLAPQDIEKLMERTLALGHPESHPDAPIYTSRGWKMISRVKPGDLVLTHQGRFKKVLRVYRRRPDPGTEKITFSRNSRRSNQSITLAGNHPVRMEDGTWRRAAEVRKGERVVHLCEVCHRCGELAPVHQPGGGAGCYCYTKEFWRTASPAARASRLRAAHRATATRVKAGLHDFTKSEVRLKGQLVQARRSPAEEVVVAALDGVELVRQYPVDQYFVDLAIPSLKIAIEVDGGRWHGTERKRRQDAAKQARLEADGWTVVRVQVRAERLGTTGVTQKIEACAAEVRRLVMNHRGQYKFAAFKVGGLWREKFDESEVLYDLSVDEDNSYVVKSLVVHNCGHFSQLSAMNADQTSDPADIPLFVDLIARLRPRFFAMDDLPKSFIAFPMAEYHRRLPGYDLFPEWVSNHGYGNVQKNRKRMFMIGAAKRERWAFTPGELAGAAPTLGDLLGDLGEPRAGSNYPNHDPHVVDEESPRGKHLVTLGRDRRATYRDLQRFFLENPPGTTLKYVSSDGVTVKHKPSHSAGYWDGHSHVLDGASLAMHPLRGLPYTIRERARIQGFPDDFVFYGTRLNAAGEWSHERNNDMVKQTGKAMPVQFGRYVGEQVAAHCRGESFGSSGIRLLDPNPYVDAAKRWYCEEVGYSDQERACGACWLYAGCTIRMRKYQIGEPARGQLDLIDPGVVPGPSGKEEVISSSVEPSARGGGDPPRASETLAAAPRAESPGYPGPPPSTRQGRGAPRSARPVSRADCRPTAPRPARKRFTDLPREEEYDLT